MKNEQMKRQTKKKGFDPIPLIFGLAFTLVGVPIFIILFCIPAIRSARALTWTKTPCTIVSSSVKTHISESDGRENETYTIEVAYKYKFNGKTYSSHTYSINAGSTSGKASKESVVASLPPGAKTFCFVNASEPENAVISRAIFWQNLLAGFLGFLFGGLGILSLASYFH